MLPEVFDGVAPVRVLLFLLRNFGAGDRTRTDDLLITNQLLYQLSYAGLLYRPIIVAHAPA